MQKDATLFLMRNAAILAQSAAGSVINAAISMHIIVISTQCDATCVLARSQLVPPYRVCRRVYMMNLKDP